MIKTSKYNGINFSTSLLRNSTMYFFDYQRRKGILPDAEVKYISFLVSSDGYNALKVVDIKNDIVSTITPDTTTEIDGGFIVYYIVPASALTEGATVYFIAESGETEEGAEKIYSEYYSVLSAPSIEEKNVLSLEGWNDDDRHGYLSKKSFGFFKATGFNEDFFINEKFEYKKSYGRKELLRSENNIGRRITFTNPSAYEQILIKWLCNCENFYINGEKYELVSDFTELLGDENSEIKDLRADFIKSELSFFVDGANLPVKNAFETSLFNSKQQTKTIHNPEILLIFESANYSVIEILDSAFVSETDTTATINVKI